jgi:hypothetical protein
MADRLLELRRERKGLIRNLLVSVVEDAGRARTGRNAPVVAISRRLAWHATCLLGIPRTFERRGGKGNANQYFRFGVCRICIDSLNLDYVRRVCEQIGSALADKISMSW